MSMPQKYSFGTFGKGEIWVHDERIEYKTPTVFGKPKLSSIPFESIAMCGLGPHHAGRSVAIVVRDGKPVSFDAVDNAAALLASLDARMAKWRERTGEPNKYFFRGTFGTGEFWVGDGRVEYNNPTMFGKPQLSYIPFESITGFFADAHLGGRTKRVRISVGGGDGIAFSAVDNIDADEFVETLRARLAKQGQPTASPSSDADELERLGSLFERGLLSDEEFAAAKKKLLGS